MGKTCGTCRWWGGRISGRVYDPGPCRRYPPQVMTNRPQPYSDQWNVWPTMKPGDFCGEHQPKEPTHG